VAISYFLKPASPNGDRFIFPSAIDAVGKNPFFIIHLVLGKDHIKVVLDIVPV
jgi:hypothetical protein